PADHGEAMATIVVERELDAGRIDRVADGTDAHATQDLEGVGRGGDRVLERVVDPHAPATGELSLDQQLQPLHGPEVAVAEDRRVGTDAERHGSDETAEAL